DGERDSLSRPLRSLEGNRPVGDFDVVAFSLSFETDYLNVLHCLRLAGIPARSRERGARAPLIIAGGGATCPNPEPLAESVDLCLVEPRRGGEWGCRCCAAGFLYRPVRYRSLRTLRESVARGLQQRRTIGLVGAEMASLPGVSALCQEVAGAGGRASPSSL